MTVSELIELLKQMPGDRQVILQKDAEGNDYSQLAEADGDCIYIPANTWSGQVLTASWSAEDAGFDTEREWEELKRKSPRCCVLAPIN